MTTLVGLLGPAGAGKSTVADHLVERYGAARYSLAAPLKTIAQLALGFSQQQLYGPQDVKEAIDPRYGFSCRWFLQRLGTEGFRHVLTDRVWINHLLRTVNAADAAELAVVDDVRFANESAWMIYWSRRAGSGGFVPIMPPPEDRGALYVAHRAFKDTGKTMPDGFVTALDGAARAVLGDDVWERDHADPVVGPGGSRASIWRMVPLPDPTAEFRAAAAGVHASEAEWATAPADVEIEPPERGIPLLLQLADEAANYLGLAPVAALP